MLPLSKTGDLSQISNYRGISISSQVAKTINKMILNRIMSKIDIHLRHNQNGFRPGRSTTANILAIRRLIEGIQNRHKKAIILYVDFRKAFYSIHRGMMMNILKAYDIPPRLLASIYTLYKNKKARVVRPEGETNLFEIRTGVLHIGSISLRNCSRLRYEANISEYRSRRGFKLRKRQSRRMTPITITDLNFADDLELITEEKEQAHDILNILEHEAGKVGIHCNSKKTEIQVFNHEVPIDMKSRDGITIKVVKNFKYLGS